MKILKPLLFMSLVVMSLCVLMTSCEKDDPQPLQQTQTTNHTSDMYVLGTPHQCDEADTIWVYPTLSKASSPYEKYSNDTVPISSWFNKQLKLTPKITLANASLILSNDVLTVSYESVLTDAGGTNWSQCQIVNALYYKQ